MWAYWYWDVYHFAKQNFGVARLCRCWFNWYGSRHLDMVLFAGGTAVIILIGPHFLSPLWTFLILTIGVSVTHWITEIILTARVCGRWLFAGAALGLGSAAFLWSVPTPFGIVIPATGVTLAFYSARIGLGIAHFLTDQWIWRLSDPQVRAVIGRDLLSVPRSCT
jgi:hypothetical protein